MTLNACSVTTVQVFSLRHPSRSSVPLFRERSGPPGGGPDQVHEASAEPATGRDAPGLPLLAGARVGFRRAAEQVRRLAALHLQCPLQHVNQVRTTSFLL